jgi:hypothetical protein
MANQQPDFRAYTVVKRDGADDFWLPIGAAFMHQNGDGYNIVLQALPLPDKDGQCKLVLRPPKSDAQTAETGPRAVAGMDREKPGAIKRK